MPHLPRFARVSPHADPILARLARGTRLVLLVLAALAGAAPGVRAQDDFEPWIEFLPSDTTVTSAALGVTVRFNDDVSLDVNTRSLTLNGTVVSGFTHGAPAAYLAHVRAVSTGTVTLQTGTNLLVASICDQTSKCSTDTTTFTYNLPVRPGVRVTPDGGAVQLAASTTHSRTFYVKNTGTAQRTYSLSAACRDAWSGQPVAGCSAAATVSVNAGDSSAVSVSVPLGAAGQVLLVRLSARDGAAVQVEDAGWIDVTATGTGTYERASQVVLVDLNNRPTSDRASCVTVAMAPRVAYECGDLRIVHPLSAARVRNRVWAPALLYNSQHAAPRPTVYADVTLPADGLVPTTVQVTVALANGTVKTQYYPGTQWAPGTTRRVAVQLDGTNMATGLYPLDVQAYNHYPSTTQSASVVPDTLLVVNRAQSKFGAGWWIAGWEQLQCITCPNGRMLWIGGDGSTRVFEPLVAGQKWTAYNPAGAPDTLKYLQDGAGTWHYVRVLRGGGEVHFNTDGVHVRTVSRLGQQTTFAFNAVTQRLTGIYSPDSTAWWVPGYNANGKVSSYAAHATGATTRTTTISIQPDGRITDFWDPGLPSIALGYTTSIPRITVYDDRRATRHYIAFDSASRVAQVRLRMSATTTSAADLLTRFEAAEGKGYQTSVATAAAYTRVDAPRDDVLDHTYIWLAARGAPRRIRDPLGAETLLIRGDSFPALVREVRSSNVRGDSLILRSRADYDGLGRVRRSTAYNTLSMGDSLSTTYAYDDRWNAPDTIITPGTGVVTMAYDATTGNRLWQQVGDTTRRVHYRYYTSGVAAGLLKAIQYPQVGVQAMIDSVAYNARGNLALTRTPLGFMTLYRSDALGRDTLVITPIRASLSSTVADVDSTGMRQRTEFDAAGRPWRTQSIGPAMLHNRFNSLARVGYTGQEMLTVESEFDGEGLVTEVRRWATPDTADVDTLITSYVYDWARRRTSVTENQDGPETYVYDKAGNVVQWTTKRTNQVTSEYDVAGRLIRRAVPAVSYLSSSVSCADSLAGPYCEMTFPSFPNYLSNRYQTPADTTWFRYDLLGRMTYAENLDAIVQRSYLPGGAMNTDSLFIRSYTGNDFTQHRYGLHYRYDALGRMRALLHPSNLASTAQRDSFAYNAVTGSLDTVVSRLGHSFGFQYDVLGRMTGETHAGGSRSYAYDLDGRKIDHDGSTLTYDARGKLLSATYPFSSVYYNTYSGLGMLVGTDWDNVNNSAVDVSDFTMDALGNTVWRRQASDLIPTRPEHRYTYEPRSARVVLIANVLPTYAADQIVVDTATLPRDSTWRAYDPAGNVDVGQTHTWRSGYGKVATQSYYGADERLRAIQTYDTRGIQDVSGLGERRGSFVEYRYDPLGRRVLVRTRRDELCWTFSSDVDCTGGIERFVWAGDNVLWELRGPGADSVPVARLEDATATGVEFGAVGYTHAGGVDRPLEASKGTGATPAMAVVPHMNWRGLFSGGTYLTGNVTTHPIVWPGLTTTAWHQNQPSQQQTKVWTGSLLGGQSDASGQMYMRNRYYDPATGQFTQTDPIGLAGGLNAYGFAAGDPVSYSDPYGFCPRVTVEGSSVLIEADFQFDGVSEDMQKDIVEGITQRWAGEQFGYNVTFNFSVPGAPKFEVTQYDGTTAGGQSWGRGLGGSLIFGTQPSRGMIRLQAAHEMGHGFGLHLGNLNHHPDENNLMYFRINERRPNTRLTRQQFEQALNNCREAEGEEVSKTEQEENKK